MDQLESIKLGITWLFYPKQLVELRARVGNYWKGFFFDDHEKLANAVLKLDQDERVSDLYYVFNEIRQDLVEARAACQCEKCAGGGLIVKNPDEVQIERIITGPSQHLSGNEDVTTLRWLFVDVDTIRAAGHEHDSSTKAEREASKLVANAVIEHLDAKGWPKPLFASSGNGWHLLYRLKQPNTLVGVSYVEEAIGALGKFSNDAAKIDSIVFNPARLTRAYGSSTRKGEHTAERPHRRNMIKEPGGPVREVSLDQLIALADEAPKTAKRGDMPPVHKDFDPEDFFRWYADQEAFFVTSYNTWNGHKIAVIDHCITAGHKHSGSTLTGFVIGNTFGYHCFSDDCAGVGIGEVLRTLHELGYKSYPKPIWPEEESPLVGFNVEEADEALGIGPTAKTTEQFQVPTEPGPEPEPKKPTITDLLEKKIAEDEREAIVEAAEMRGEEPPPPPAEQPNKPKPVQLTEIKPNQYAEWLMAIVFRDPKAVQADYSLFRKRLKAASVHLADTVKEAFGSMMYYEAKKKHLPTREELIDYLLHDTDCMEVEEGVRKATVSYVKGIEDDGTHFFDTTAERMVWEVDWEMEVHVTKEAFRDILREQKGKTDCIQSFRAALKKHWAKTVGLNSDFRPGTLQENVENIYEAFRRDVAGEADSRKFRTGFSEIDNGMNIGLDGNHAIVLYGPAANRKTNAAMTWALNFAMDGKRGLFLAGEHLREKIEKRFTLMLSYYLRKTEDNPHGIVPVIPGLLEWEGMKRTATYDDLANVRLVLDELPKAIGGHLEVQNIDSLVGGEEDPVGAIMAYVESTHRKYNWDFVVIDPLDSILPTDTGQDQFQESCSRIERLFKWSRNFAGDRGLMLVVTAQFRAETRRDIEKVQAKNGGVDDFDDEIVAILRRDSNIQYIGNKLTQRFDLAIGVALRVKDGEDGLLALGRSREAGLFDVMQFTIDKQSNLMLESTGSVVRKAAKTATAPGGEPSLEDGQYDTL